MATGVEDLKDLVTSIKFPIVNWNKDGSLRVLDLPESKAEYEKLFRLGHDLFESRSIVSQERLSNDPLFWIFIFKQLIMLKKNYSSTDEDTTSKPVAIQLVQSVLSNEKVHHEQVDFTCSPTLLLLGSIKAIESIFKDSFRKSPFLEDFCFLHAGHRTRRISLQHEYDETNKDSKSERYFLVEAFLELSLYFNLNVLRNVIWVEMILILLDDWRIPLKTQGLNLIQKLANENEFLVTYKSVLMESLFESTLSDPLPYMKQCLETFIFLGKNFKDTESEEAINDFIIGFLLRELTFANYSPEWFNVDEAFVLLIFYIQ